MPCKSGGNYIILDAIGRGHYVGCILNVLQQAPGWWGEGDDMIYVDGEKEPSLHGTGSEDYFSGAWGMSEDKNLFYGCPLQDPDFQVGSKATVYRFHIPDPIPFKKSIRVTIEHGHANNRSDYYSSIAYWYQCEPHKTFPSLPSVEKRLPFAKKSPGNFIFPEWNEIEEAPASVFEDKKSGMKFEAETLFHLLTSYYNTDGERYAALMTENAHPGTTAKLSFPIEIGEGYNIDLYFLKGPSIGNIRVSDIRAGVVQIPFESELFRGLSSQLEIGVLPIRNVLIKCGMNSIFLQIMGKDPESVGTELGFVGLTLTPCYRRFIKEWNFIGPFDAPDIKYLKTAYPPETAISLNKSYRGKGNMEIAWRKTRGEETGYIRLGDLIQPHKGAIAYALVYVLSPKTYQTYMLLGSDDGIRVWLNDTLIHTNYADRDAYLDQDKIKVFLREGWNKVLIKVLEGDRGPGFYLRFADPDGILSWSTEVPK